MLKVYIQNWITKIYVYRATKYFFVVLFVFIGPLSKASYAASKTDSVINEQQEPYIFSSDAQPQSIYFRYAEGSLRKQNYTEKWAKRWSKLDGVIVKALEEEIGNITKPALPKLSYYRNHYPGKLMMLHINGSGRTPTFNLSDYDASHFLYYQGTYNLTDIPATTATTTIKVKDITNFKLKSGRGNRGIDDLVLTSKNWDGTPDWDEYEYLTLTAINKKNKTISVKRAQFGTEPLELDGTDGYIAVHVASGPWLKGSKQKVWSYNWSNTAPIGPSNKTLSELMSSELAAMVNSGGEMEMFNGIAFDVLTDRRGNKKNGRTVKIDFNGDGRGNSILTKGVNTWSLGVLDFLTQLRQKLEQNKLITADGHKVDHQRGFGILNGIESEAWPDHYDLEVNHWSDGINRHRYWNMVSREPKFSYVKIEHYYDKGKIVELSENIQRLIIAGTLFSDAVVSPSNKSLTGRHDNWPELTAGNDNKLHWLGKPLADYQRVNQDKTMVTSLNGNDLLSAMTSKMSKLTLQANKVVLVSSSKTKEVDIDVTIPFTGLKNNLVIEVIASADSMESYPTNRARLMKLQSDINSNISFMSWIGKDDFKSIFYYDKIASESLAKGSAKVNITIEGNENLVISEINFINSSEFSYREYEHGLVIANPSYQKKEINLDKILPKQCFKRLKSKFLKNYYNGNKVDKTIKVNAKDALFLKRC